MLHVWLSAVMLSLAGAGSAFQAPDPTVASTKGTFDLVKGQHSEGRGAGAGRHVCL